MKGKSEYEGGSLLWGESQEKKAKKHLANNNNQEKRKMEMLSEPWVTVTGFFNGRQVIREA